MRRILIAVAALAFVTGRYTAPTVLAKPIVTVKREVVTEVIEAPPVHCPAAEPDEPDDDPSAVDVESTETFRMLVEESRRIANAGGIRGQVRDTRTGENLAGVTITASAGVGTQSAITDENGEYAIAQLEPGNYIVTMYYLDQTLEHRDIVVSSQQMTPLYARIDSAGERYIYVPPPSIDPDDIRYTID